MAYFLGVDIGNSKSHALIADAAGRCVGYGVAGAGSWETVGWDGARAVLHSIVQQALAQAALPIAALAGAGFGCAGYDWPEDRPGHLALIASLGLGQTPFVVGNDTRVALAAGAPHGWGVVIVAGTGNNCYGRDRQGREGRITGAGAWLGEYGGAAELVERAVQAVAAAWSRRAPATALTAALLAHAGAADADDLLAGLIRGRYTLDAAAAPLIFAVAASGDAVAQEVVTWAGRALGAQALGVIRQLELAAQPFDVVLAGSLFRAGEPLIAPLRATIHASAPAATLARLTAPPVVGGVLLGMQQTACDWVACRPHLLRSAAALLPA